MKRPCEKDNYQRSWRGMFAGRSTQLHGWFWVSTEELLSSSRFKNVFLFRIMSSM